MKKPTWKPIKVRLGQIKAWEHNPRLSTKAQAKRLIASENEFGQSQAFNLNPLKDGLYPLLDGHQRLSAWLTIYGPEYKMDGRVCSRTLNEDERKKYVIVHHVGATGSWDWNALSGWDDDNLESWGIDQKAVDGWNNDANNAKEMLAAKEEHADAEPEIDRADELQEKWQCETGQLWKIGDHRLIVGDCTDAQVVERLMAGEKADICLTDPPYNVGREYADDKDGDNLDPEQYKKWSIDWFNIAQEVSGNIAFSCGLRNVVMWAKIKEWKWMICWYKQNAMLGSPFGIGNWEPILFYGKVSRPKGSDVIVVPIVPTSTVDGHPVPKQLGVYEKLIELLTDGCVVVYEPFTGSGTTLVACENLNRKGRGVEISEKYCAVTLERMATAFPELVIEKIE